MIAEEKFHADREYRARDRVLIESQGKARDCADISIRDRKRSFGGEIATHLLAIMPKMTVFRYIEPHTSSSPSPLEAALGWT